MVREQSTGIFFVKAIVSFLGTALLIYSTITLMGGDPSKDGDSSTTDSHVQLTLFVAQVVRAPIEEIIPIYEKRTGVKVTPIFGASGQMLSQIITSRSGDIYLPASDMFIKNAKEKKVINPSSIQTVSSVIPVIQLSKNSSTGIKSLADLGESGVKIGIGRPDTTAIGAITEKLLSDLEGQDQKNKELATKIQGNIVTNAKNAEELVNLLQLGKIDAAINWNVYSSIYPDEIMSVDLPGEATRYRDLITGAVIVDSKNRKEAADLLAFLTGKEAQEIFEKYGFVDPK